MGNKLSYPEEDLTGKVAIVTGGNTGIGYETAKGLARLGAHTFIACRSKEKAEEAIKCMKDDLNSEPKQVEELNSEPKPEDPPATNSTPNEGDSGTSDAKEPEEKEPEEEVRSKNSNGAEGGIKKEMKVEYLPLDLASFQSTIECVRLFKEKNLPLHILINNAAVAWIPFDSTADGYETQLQVNHLAPMLFTIELLPVLLEGASDGRIIFVSSGAHYRAPSFNAERFIITEESYDRMNTYPTTKLYNVMVGYALQRRLTHSGITVSSLQPGYVKTDLYKGIQDLTLFSLLNKFGSLTFARSPKDGAATSLCTAVDPKLNSQEHHYYSNCKQATPSSDARSESFQELLWKMSIDVLKEYLSPQILEKYGSVQIQTPPTTGDDTGAKPLPSETAAEDPVTTNPEALPPPPRDEIDRQ